jgi:hypothetical protein
VNLLSFFNTSFAGGCGDHCAARSGRNAARSSAAESSG